MGCTPQQLTEGLGFGAFQGASFRVRTSAHRGLSLRTVGPERHRKALWGTLCGTLEQNLRLLVMLVPTFRSMHDLNLARLMRGASLAAHPIVPQKPSAHRGHLFVLAACDTALCHAHARRAGVSFRTQRLQAPGLVLVMAWAGRKRSLCLALAEP